MGKKCEYGDYRKNGLAVKRNVWHFLVLVIVMMNQLISPVYAYESLTKENISPHVIFEIDETTKNILSATTVLVNQDVLISLNFHSSLSRSATVELGSNVQLNKEQTFLLNETQFELSFDAQRNRVEVKSQDLPLSSIQLSVSMVHEESNVLTVVQEDGHSSELTIISHDLREREALIEADNPASKVDVFSNGAEQTNDLLPSELSQDSEVEMVDTSEFFKYSGTTRHLSDLIVDLTGKNRLSGQMWSKKKIDLNAPFQLEFNTYLGDALAERVADGIALVFRNGEATHVGEWGSGMGAYGNKLGKASILEFDTFYNTKRNSKSTGDHDEEIINSRLDNNNHVGHVAIRNSDQFDNVSSHEVLAMGTKSEPISNGKWLPVKYNWDPDANGGTGQISGSIGTISFIKDYNIRDNVSNPESVIWGITSSTGLYETHQAVYFTKVKIGNNLTILKVDEENRPLAGAKFDIINKETNELVKEGLLSNEEGEGSYYLPIGDYIVRETEAPEGYIVSTKDVDVVVTESNYQSDISIVVENKKQMVQGELIGEKTVSPRQAKTGDVVTYSIKASNTKIDSLLTGVMIGDELSAGLRLLPESIRLNDRAVEAMVTNNSFVVKVGELVGLADAVVTFQAEVIQDEDKLIKNTAAISADDSGVLQPEVSLPVVESIGTLGGSKTVSPTRAKAGETVTYTIKSENTKVNSLLKEVLIRDELPEGLILLPETIQLNGKPVKAEVKTNGFVVNAGELAGKEGAVVTFQAKVTQDYNGEIENIGLVSAQDVKIIEAKTKLLVVESIGILSGSKTVSPIKAKTGESVTYTIKAINDKESSSLNGTLIKDELPEGLTLLPETIQLNGKPVKAEVKANGFVVNAGELVGQVEAVVTFQAKVTQDYNGEIENIGLVSAKDVKSTQPKATVSIVESVGTLSGSKTVSPIKAKISELVTYTIKAGNTKTNTSLNDVVIGDELPEGLLLLPETIQLNGKPVKSEIKTNGFVVNAGELAGKAEAVVTFQAKVTQDYNGEIENIGLVSAKDVNSIQPKTKLSIIESVGTLSGSKTVSPTKVKTGETVTYTIKAENTKANTSLNDVIIGDELPEGLLLLPETIQLNGKPVKAEVKANRFVVKVGELAGKAEAVVTFQAKVTQDHNGEIENIGLVGAKDIKSPQPKATVSIVESVGTLSGSKTVSPTKAKTGETISYTIKAGNTKANTSLTGVIIGDELPEGLTLLPETIQLNGKLVKAEIKNNGFVVKVGELAGKAEAVVTLQAKVTQDYNGEIENIGLVGAKDVNSIQPKTKLSIIESVGTLSGNKIVSPTKVKTGETVTYTIKAENTKANTSLNDAVIGDELPEGLLLLPETIQLNGKPVKAEVKANGFVVKVGELAGKAEAVVTFQAKVTQDHNGEIENIGLVSAKDVKSPQPKATVSIVESVGILSGSKTVSPTKAKTGETVTYTIKAGNTKANTSLNDVVIGDELPEGLTLLPETIQLNGKLAKAEVKDNGFVVNAGELVGKAEAVVTFQAKVTQDYNGEIENIGLVSAKDVKSTQPKATVSIVESVGILSGNKTVSPAKAKTGETVTYTIKAGNTKANTSLNDAVIGDELPEGLLLLPETIQLNGKPVKSEIKTNGFVVNVGELGSKAEAVVTFQAKVTQDHNGEIENIGLVSAKDVNSIQPKTKLSIIDSVGTLSGSKTVSSIEAKTSSIVTYTIKASNTKDKSLLTDVIIGNDLPDGLTLLSETIQLNGKLVKAEIKANSFVVNVGELAGKAESVVTYQAKVTQNYNGQIESVGLVSAKEVENIHPKANLLVVESVGTLSGSKTVSPTKAKTGETVTYTIKAGNTKANTSLNDVVIGDELPEGLTLLPETIQLNGKPVKSEIKDNGFVVNVGELAGKAEAVVTFQAKVTQDYNGEIENIGLVSAKDVKTTQPKATVSIVESVGTLGGSKTVSPIKAKISELVTYTIKSSNTKKNSSLTGVIIGDELPEGLTLLPETIQLNGKPVKAEIKANGFVVKVGELVSKAEAVVTFQAKVTQDYNGEIENIGLVSAKDVNSIQPKTKLSIIESVGTLSGNKTVSPANAKTGETVTYTIKAENTKTNTSLNDAVIGDELPEGLLLLPETIQLNGKPVKSEIKTNGFVVNAGELAGKAEAVVTFQAKVTQDYNGEIENIGLVSAKDVKSTQPKATVSIVESVGTLSGSKTVSPTKAKTGETISYTIKAGNTKANTSLTGVIIGDELPEGLTLLPETIQLNGKLVKAEIKDNGFVVNAGELAGKAEAVVTFQAKVTQDYNGEIENIGLVSAKDVKTTQPKATVSIVESVGILSGSKTVSPIKAKISELVTYTIKASNTKKNSSLTGVIIGDELPEGLTLLPETIQLNGKPVKAEIKANGFVVKVGELVSKAEAVVTFQAKVTQDYNGEIENIGLVSAKDVNSIQPKATVSIAESVGTLRGNKTVSPAKVKTGETVTYTIKAENTKANTSLNDVIIGDELPEGLTLLPETIQLNGKLAKAEVKDNGFVVNAGELVGKAEAVVTFQAKVTQDHNGEIENIGLVGAKDIKSTQPKATVSIVESVGTLGGSKTVSLIKAKTGETVTYTIKAGNTKANTSLTGVIIGDELPEGLTLLPETIQLNGKPVKSEIKTNGFVVKVGELVGKAEAAVTFQAIVTQDHNGEIENIGLVSAQDVKSTQPKAKVSIVESVGTLGGNKTVSPAKAKTGETISYTIKAGNTKANTSLNDVVIGDELPEGLTLLPETIQLNGKPVKSEIKTNGFVVKVGELVGKAEAVVTFQARVTQDYNGEIENIGLVGAKDVKSIQPKAKVSIVESVGTLRGNKTVSPTKVKTGETVTYTIKAENTKGNTSLTGVIIGDELPEGLTLLPETIQLNGKLAKAEVKDNGFVVKVGELVGKAEAAVTFQAKVAQGHNGEIENIGLVSAKDVKTTQPKAAVSIVESVGTLSGNKTVSPTKAKTGETVTYVIKAENTKANTSLTGVIIGDELPEGLTLLPETIQLNGKLAKAEVKDNGFVVNAGELVGKAEAVVTFQAKVTQDYNGEIENVALISEEKNTIIRPAVNMTVTGLTKLLNNDKPNMLEGKTKKNLPLTGNKSDNIRELLTVLGMSFSSVVVTVWWLRKKSTDESELKSSS